jgi:hypothetical protein
MQEQMLTAIQQQQQLAQQQQRPGARNLRTDY